MVGRFVTVELDSGAYFEECTLTNTEWNGRFDFKCRDMVAVSPINPKKKRYRDLPGRIRNAHNAYGAVEVNFFEPICVCAFVPVIELIPYLPWKQKTGYQTVVEKAGFNYEYCSLCEKETSHRFHVCQRCIKLKLIKSR